MAFEKQLFVHFDQCDPAGIVFYGNYAALGHRVLEEFIVSMGIPWEEWFACDRWGVPIRHLEIEYLKPLYAGQKYLAHASISKLGETSVSFEVKFKEVAGDVCSRISSTHVFINVTQMKPLSIPDAIREKLKVASKTRP